MGRGFFLVFEGIDGAGTTTQSRLLRQRLGAERPALDVVQTAEPTDRPVGRVIRDVLGGRITGDGASGRHAPFDRRALALLFAADRLDHVAGEIEPNLAAGRFVICDRYVLSSLAYQGMDAPREWVKRINSFAPRPELTIFLDCEPDVAFGRIDSRSDAKEIFETPGTLQRVAGAYRESIGLVGSEGLVEVDGNLSAGEVADLVWKSVEPLLPRV